ncbi:hypothetical protein [Melissospora conviva]|uniref:hypothetical protein n=1 Tax=Melissospora conviva TaxID=3388432 RepID=UPI003B773173
MAKLATFAVAAVLGAALGLIGITAAVGAVSPSAEHVAEESKTNDIQSEVYGTR